MFFIGRFIFSTLFTAMLVAAVSIAWPKFTPSQRPEILESVYQTVKNTPLGVQTSQVLGVSDKATIEPINVQSLLVQMKDWAAGKIQDRAEEIVTKQAVNQISQSFDKLNDKEKAVLQAAICQPATASGSQ